MSQPSLNYFFSQLLKQNKLPTNIRNVSMIMRTTTHLQQRISCKDNDDDEDMILSTSTPQRDTFRMPKLEIATLNEVRQQQGEQKSPPMMDMSMDMLMEPSSGTCTTQDDALLYFSLERTPSSDSTTSSIFSSSSTITHSSLDDVLQRSLHYPTKSSSSSPSKRSPSGRPTHRRTEAFFI
jgi:hypothetical protein